MTFKITARKKATDLEGDSMLLGNAVALEFIGSGIKGKASGSITIEYVGEDVVPEMGDELAETYRDFAEKRYGTSPTLEERG